MDFVRKYTKHRATNIKFDSVVTETQTGKISNRSSLLKHLVQLFSRENFALMVVYRDESFPQINILRYCN